MALRFALVFTRSIFDSFRDTHSRLRSVFCYNEINMSQPQQREAREQQRNPELSEFANDYLENLPEKKTEFLERHEKWLPENHEGIAPEAKVKRWGGTPESEERKEVCEDAALKMPEKGLYVVADGVSTAGGWFASRVATEHLSHTLGEVFDKRVDNLASTISQDGRTEGKQTVEQVTEDIRRQMDSAIRDLNRLIVEATRKNPREYGTQSGSTLAVAKVIELPNGSGDLIQRMFYSTLGDSPIFVKRKNGEVKKICREDTVINMRLDAGMINEADIEAIHLARDEYSLPQRLRDTYKQAQVIMQNVGGQNLYIEDGNMLRGIKPDLVQYIDLQPGDRVILASDGFSDQFRGPDIDGMLAMTEGDDEAADQLMQERALESSRKGRRANPLAKRDDIAAMSFTAQERGPSREYLKGDQEVGEVVSIEKLNERLVVLIEQLAAAKEVHQQKMSEKDADLMPLTERLPLEIKVLELEGQVEATRYDIERAKLNKVDKEVPPRFKQGDSVRLFVNTDQGRIPHPNQWHIAGYDAQRSQYQLQDQAGQEYQMSRYQLELDQGTVSPRRGDVIPYYMPGLVEQGYVVTATDARGNVRVEKEKGQIVNEGEMDAADTQHTYLMMLNYAARTKERMDSRADAYHQTNDQVGPMRQQLSNVQEMEARNVVMTRFQGEIREHTAELQALDRQISNAERILERFKELSKTERLTGLDKDQQAEIKKLKLKVYPTTQRPRLDESYIQGLRDERVKLKKKVITRE
jgi:serine/threonine protein phosphatase PrpC